MDFLNSKVGRRYGDGFSPEHATSEHILGRMVPVRANTVPDESIPPYPGEAEGSAIVLTEVQPWPFAVDDQGIAFDQANLYGVRSVCRRRPLASGGGDNDFWTAVPRQLPSGYMAVGRCGLLIPGVYDDHLAYCGPEGGFQWNHRLPTRLRWDLSDVTQSCKAAWGPMNRNDQHVNHGGGALSGGIVSGSDPLNRSILYGSFLQPHVGFRGGKVTLTLTNPSGTVPYTTSVKLGLFSTPCDIDIGGWTDADSPPSWVNFYWTCAASHLFSSFADPPYVKNFTVGTSIPSGIGMPHSFWLYAYNGEAAGMSITNVGLSPRTDVPLWYFASMGNRCAPGGYVPP